MPNRKSSVSTIDEIIGQSIDSSYGVITFSLDPCSSSEPHSHESEETWIVRSGTGRAVIGVDHVQLETGSRVTVPPNVEHFIVNENASRLIILSFWWRDG